MYILSLISDIVVLNERLIVNNDEPNKLNVSGNKVLNVIQDHKVPIWKNKNLVNVIALEGKQRDLA